MFSFFAQRVRIYIVRGCDTLERIIPDRFDTTKSTILHELVYNMRVRDYQCERAARPPHYSSLRIQRLMTIKEECTPFSWGPKVQGRITVEICGGERGPMYHQEVMFPPRPSAEILHPPFIFVPSFLPPLSNPKMGDCRHPIGS